MPLLGKEEFCLKTLPSNLSPDEQVFYCNITGEAFLSYDEYFERQFLYSSLLWTCAVTGKTGLTYSEALKSENESQTLLSSIPRLLQKVLLHLMTYLNNFSTNVTISILIEYTNLRYFIGENVQILSKNKSKRINGIIRDVLPPQNYESSNTVAYGVDPLSYNYVVEFYEDQKDFEIIPAARISRSKCLLTREKIRLFLKQHLAPKNGRYETLSIKEESIHRFGLDNLKWEDIYKGPTPNFNDDTLLVKALNKQRFSEEFSLNNTNESQDENSNEINMENENSVQVLKKKSNLLSTQKQKLIKREEKYKSEQNERRKMKKCLKKERLKKLNSKNKGKPGRKKKNFAVDNNREQEEIMASSKQNKAENRNREKEFKKLYEEDLKIWMEKRDDLLCDDLRPLPRSTPIECDIEKELIGDALVIIDFINVFREYISFEENFPSYMTFEYFSRILKDNNVTGTGGFGDLLIALFGTILISNQKNQQDEKELIINENNNDEFDIFNAMSTTDDEETSSPQNNCFSNHWVTTYCSSYEQLSKLQLDYFTLTEILRIYILKTRNYDGKRCNKICQEDMSLVMKLSILTVFELNQSDRIKIIKLLLNDMVVKVPDIRQKIENSMEEMFKLKTQIRHMNAAYTKWLRDNPIRQRMRKKKQNSGEDETGQAETENEMSKEEKEQYKKDKAEKEKQMKKDIAELKAKIRKLSAYCRSRPLGLDRTYRKFWIFESIPGLFVEHSIEGDALPCFENPLPMTKPELTNYLPNAKRLKKKTVIKENCEAGNNSKESNFNKNLEHFDRCTGNPSTCAVHGLSKLNQQTRWSFYTKEQFGSLMESLNSRGFREMELKNALAIEKQTILANYLEDFDPFMFNKNYVPPLMIDKECEENQEENNYTIRKSERLQLHDKIVNKRRMTKNECHLIEYSNTSPVEAFDVNFQNRLLIFEDNVFNSCFCSFSLADRDEWYRRMTRTYCGDKINSLSLLTSKLSSLAKSIRPFCLIPPLSVYPELTMSSPSEKENIENNKMPKFRVPILSEKWLDVLKVPDEMVSLGSINSNDFESSYGITNHSQLYVNLHILEKSLNWDMSALKTANKCGICKRKANDEMILCDFCNRGYHIFCLTPPISSVNEIEGDWYCYKCVPKSDIDKKSPTNNKNPIVETKLETTNNQEEENDKSLENEDNRDDIDVSLLDRCKSCGKPIYEAFSEVLCKTCGEYFHLSCVNLVRIPRSWNCMSCHQKERYEQYQNSHDNDNGELRRSQRKRKPNHYHEFEPNDDNYLTNLKTRRCSDNNAEYHRIIVK